MDADVRVLLAVHDQRGGHFDVGVVEVGELGFPVLVLELEEDGAQDVGVVEACVGIVLDVGGRDLRAGLGRVSPPLPKPPLPPKPPGPKPGPGKS